MYDLSDLRHDLWMLIGDVVLLADILGQVIEGKCLIAFFHVASDRFVFSDSDRLLAAVPGKLPIEILVLALFPLAAFQRGQEREAIDALGDRRARDLGQGQQDVLDPSR